MWKQDRYALLLVAAGAIGCANNPQYVEPGLGLDYDPAVAVAPVVVSLTLPTALETVADLEDRTRLAEQLQVEVPYVRLDDMTISVEWSIKNLSAEPGEARIFVNGGNEFFYYVPSLLLIDPDEDEDPPPLLGNIPLHLDGSETLSGVFREDQLTEASIDLELITRGNLNPFAAVLQIHEDLEEYQPMTPLDPNDPGAEPTPVGPVIPRSAFALMVRLDIGLVATTHMVLEYAVRIRDHRGILHEDLMAAPPEELTVFSPVEYNPLGVP
jgi:hypothetical protein